MLSGKDRRVAKLRSGEDNEACAGFRHRLALCAMRFPYRMRSSLGIRCCLCSPVLLLYSSRMGFRNIFDLVVIRMMPPNLGLKILVMAGSFMISMFTMSSDGIPWMSLTSTPSTMNTGMLMESHSTAVPHVRPAQEFCIGSCA